MRASIAIILILAITPLAGCSDDTSTGSQQTNRPLAGGGRFESDDPFTGGPDDSGPQTDDSAGIWPPDDPNYPYFDVLLSHDVDCDSTPQRVAIRDSATWHAWWEVHTSCMWWDCWTDTSGDGTIRDSLYPDDSVIIGDCKVEPPIIDFEHESVIAISVEYDSGSFCMRSVWITDIESGESGTTVAYDVTQLDSTCCMLIMAPMLARGQSPIIAVRVPYVINDEPTWIRHDTAYDCYWQPDPNEPLAIYYTDATCELGPHEQIITDQERWAEWYHQAWACDSARWGHYVDSSGVIPGDDSTTIWDPNGDSVKPEPWPDLGIPYWIPEVDFSTHAVIILRAGDQTRWGGGIWLTNFQRGSAGTAIDYTVSEPSGDCPPVEFMGTSVNPTVAIRLPLPLDPPITWDRYVEVIDCHWYSDTSWVDTTGNGWPPPDSSWADTSGGGW